MITINNPKIAGLSPVWNDFRGFSLLFDTPDIASSDCAMPAFYVALNEALDKIGKPDLLNAFLCCPLPAPSFHVTLWDGVNDGNLSNIQPATYRDYFRSFLKNLPASLDLDQPFAELTGRSKLLQNKSWGMVFKFSSLFVWRHSQALVALLEPTGALTQAIFEEIKVEREKLYRDFESVLQMEMYRKYSPHITLGYFLNKESAALAAGHLPYWNRIFEDALVAQRLTFNSISIYGFTSMASFFKY